MTNYEIRFTLSLLHHSYGSVFTGPFFYLCVVEMKGTSHPWGMLCMPPRGVI